MIDLSNEELMPIAAAPQIVPGRPHVSTLHRWRQRRDAPLETVKVGGRIFTSRQAVERFIVRCSGCADIVAPSEARERRIAKAERELADAGI